MVQGKGIAPSTSDSQSDIITNLTTQDAEKMRGEILTSQTQRSIFTFWFESDLSLVLTSQTYIITLFLICQLFHVIFYNNIFKKIFVKSFR